MGLFDGTALEQAIVCERCALEIRSCQCPPLPEPIAAPVPPELQKITLRVERRKKGKVVTVLSGLTGSELQQRELLTRLKDFCGAGGTQADTGIEIQGDHAKRLLDELSRQGFRVISR
jgi:translation initiation factor 1